MGKPINGLLVAYNDGRGVVLLQHPSIPSVEQLAKRYARSPDDRGFWFASFVWMDIAETDREFLHKSGKSVRNAMLGRRVICTLVRDPKWRAAWLSIDLDQGRLALPERRAHPEWFKQLPPKKTAKPSRRLARHYAPRGNNARRPWGGMGQ